MRVLIAEPVSMDATVLEAALRPQGIVSDVCVDTDDFVSLLRRYDYDLVVLSTELPKDEALGIIRRIRRDRLETPILAITPAHRPQYRALSLSAGADDAISKPIDPTEFAARVTAIVRRSRGYAQPKMSLGNLVVDLGNCRATVNETEVHLTAKERLVLQLLMLRKGAVISKQCFLTNLYNGMDEPDSKIIDVFICKLRKKLAEAGADVSIRTIWGTGYALFGPEEAARKQPAEEGVLDYLDNTPSRVFEREMFARVVNA